jgi:release factor glutamine methyltransferase
MTIKELLIEGSKRLSRSSIRSSSKDLDCEVLLGFVLGISREKILGDFFWEVPAEDASLYFKYVDEVAGGKPVAYITHSREFYGLDFYVDERVLVPRPETEMVVEEVLGFLRENAGEFVGHDATVLDVGTGSLCITCAILKNFENAFAYAVDVSEDALEVAAMNRGYHGLETRCQIFQSDLLSNVSERKFDVIVANLPYVEDEAGGVSGGLLSEGVRKFEPGSALFGGGDGLELYKKLIQEIVEKKVEFDLLVCEFGFGQEALVSELLSKNFDQGKFKWEIKKDLAGIPRIFVVRSARADLG